MKRALGVLASSVVLVFPRAASAQGDEPPPPLPPPSVTVVQAPPPPVAPAQPAPTEKKPDEKKADDKHEDKPKGPRPVPDARTGFQMSLRTGLMVPIGKVQSGTNMYDVFSPQVPFQVDLGWKVIPEVYLGIYLGASLGGVNNRLSDLCDRTNADCGTATFSIGLEGQYHFAPARKLNPWIGYGLGFEAAGFGNTVGPTTQTTVWSGFDFARVSGGFDARISRVIGIGPLLDVTFGRYAHQTYELKGPSPLGSNLVAGKTDSTVDERRTHAWLTMGVRLVFFP